MKRMGFLEFAGQVRSHRRRIAEMARNDGPDVRRLACLHDIEKWAFIPWLWIWHGGRAGRIARIGYDAMNAMGALIEFTAIPSTERRRIAAKRVRIYDVVDRARDPQARREFGDNANDPIASILRHLDDDDDRTEAIALAEVKR